ncbi:DEAD/DEAH box helicase [Phyllobacterium leguminum]|uniref:AAA domain-containing protein n=1 Tax=Phyllobacterium leguminum TaxID=314237 RepID=A0A318T4Q5_9HYPH|nr:AAA domain-containing protein [Phyllobacterium leguminum]PYE85304.1 AAA domain-containing protein [Phyllobacterium leguminum]
MNVEQIDRERLQAILEYWHRIEFFIPFDLSARAEKRENRACFLLHAETLEDDFAHARRPEIPADKEIVGVTIFFGVFDKSEMVESLHAFCAPADELSQHEDAERGDLEGDTCFASLDLDVQGNPLFSQFSISTLPWALGCLREGKIAGLSSSAFAQSKKRLEELLRNFAEQRRLDRSTDTESEGALTSAEILTLNDLLQSWAGFKPKQDRPVAMVEFRLREKRKSTAKQLEAPKTVDMSAGEMDEDEEDEAEVEYEIGILNSFYLEDIERAIVAVRDGAVPEALRQYLTPLEPEARFDLYSDRGRLAILEALHPRHVNRGRWPSEPHHAMSLMQQFAINEAVKLHEEGGLFSVNGPPGTGKTTLLRDIIADNVVKRAQILAGLASPRDAFTGRGKSIELSDGSSVTVSALIPELTNFGMVVASSNNTAVENISRDLPKRSSIAKQSSIEYLQTVGHKVAAQTRKGTFETLKEKDRPWGLISCVLGNAGNRRAFTSGFAFPAMGADHTVQKGDSVFQTIWGWLDSYRGPSFAEAVEEFRAAQAKVDAGLARSTRYADILNEVGLCSREEYCRDASKQIDVSGEAEQAARRAHEAARGQMQAAETRLSELKEEERLLDRAAPAWWQGLLPTRAGQDHRAKKAENAQAQLSINRQLSLLRQSLAKLAAEMEHALAEREECQAALAARQDEWTQKRAELSLLGEALGNPAIPETLDDLETDRFQIAGLWHCDELAAQRSDLFAAALRLHAAWLAAAGQKGGGFRGNILGITKLLSNTQPVEPEAIANTWHSFFMIVPVVSTTFASFARQFRGVGAGGIGWLFIDEAGQSVPQAAVGALMRSRNAMIIGDPLQIEPVFTLPTAFLKALGELSPHTETGEYSPARASVQTLADAANKFGAAVTTESDDPLWIGSPLRVHRRCIDPMFSLANRIAYHGKMVFAAGERTLMEDVAPFYGDSAWIDIGGRVAGKQTVPEQVAFIVAVLAASFRRDGSLPDIYIISPFKETKAALKREIEKVSWVGPDSLQVSRPKKLAQWLKDRIGTVHTFQGKEENAVFLVLGTDATRRGAAAWAASRPNLLNVAATRARYRLFIVADRDLWRGLQYFSDAAGMLPPVGEADFLARLRA